jgi:glutathione S-transferase
MFNDDRIALTGAPGSPYTRKMLAVLRYRRIPYRFLPPASPELQRLPRPKVQLLPTFFLPGPSGELEAVVDSSPIIRRLEDERSGRSAIPTDPATAFLDELIEDYADEWLTKAMFHYRWAYQADIDQAARILPCWRGYSTGDEVLAERSKAFAERQVGRLFVVGSNAVTAPVIEASYRRFLEAFEAHLAVQPFLLGARPGASDFAVFGQLTQLAQFDPTPMALTLKIAPRVFAWVGLMETNLALSQTTGTGFRRTPRARP